MLGGIKFYERAEIKDCIAYLRIIFQEKDDLAFERVVNNPKRSIGESTIKQIHEYAKKNSIPYLIVNTKFSTKLGYRSFRILPVCTHFTYRDQVVVL